MLNRDNPSDLPNIQEAPEDLDINVELPTKKDIFAAIKELKNHKALFKTDPDLILPLFVTIWKEKTIPVHWCKGTIVKKPNCHTWRGITLLSVPSKIFCKIIVKRLSTAVGKVLRKEQAGFRKGRGCTDHICTLRNNIIEQCTEWQRELCIHFIDFEKAFDTIYRDSPWRILRTYGIPPHIVDLIKLFYVNYTRCIGQSDIAFKVKSGVRQGCVIQHCHRLGYEENNGRTNTRDKMDTVLLPREYRLRRCCSSPVPYTKYFTGKDK